MNKFIFTATTFVMLASSALADPPQWRVTHVKPNLWGGMQIEQHDSDGHHRSIRMKPNWFGGSTIIEHNQ